MTLYPRTYRLRPGVQIFLVALSLLTGILCLGGIFLFGAGDFRDTATVYLRLGVCLLGAATSVYLLLTAWRSKIVLLPDAVEIHEVGRTRTIRRDNVAGWRLTATPALVLNLKQPAGKTISTTWFYPFDSEFQQWLASVDDLDLRDVASGLDEIAADQRMGSTEQARFANLVHAKRLAKRLSILGGVLCFWGVFSPTPYSLVIGLLLAAPWLAIFVVWRSNGLIQFDERPNDVKPSVVALYLFPMMALTLRAVLDYQTIGWIAPTIAAVFIGSALFAAQCFALQQVQTSRMTLALLFVAALALYGFGAARHLNVLADSSDIQQMRYIVREKHISTGKITRHIVDLQNPALNVPHVRSSEVAPSFYDTLKPGDSICLRIHRGILWIKWFEAGPCLDGMP